MSDKEQGPQLPRPWYISLTAIWKEAENFDALAKWSRALLRTWALQPSEALRRAGNHVPIPRDSWHFTLLAIMKINGYPGGTQNMRKFAGRIFQPVPSDNALVGDLRAGFKPFTAKLDRVRCFDDGTTLEFECGKALEDFRNHARRVLGAPVSSLVSLHTNSEAGRRFRETWGVPLVESTLDDPNKNYGMRAFGSIARSPFRSDRSVERWHEEFKLNDVNEKAPPELKFSRIHLLISDEMLTNPRVPEAEDVPIEAS
jgi:hypothetical protein